eukprot:gb/GECG01014435.1/.p1 GENE.gb/GECG01014435.1/~~gb/GECG01014435.1/.p1  ORF type:complete len:383 (+),score=63.60 gb/GECG01014435.1/:1-1149(+)
MSEKEQAGARNKEIPKPRNGDPSKTKGKDEASGETKRETARTTTTSSKTVAEGAAACTDSGASDIKKSDRQALPGENKKNPTPRNEDSSKTKGKDEVSGKTKGEAARTTTTSSKTVAEGAAACTDNGPSDAKNKKSSKTVTSKTEGQAVDTLVGRQQSKVTSNESAKNQPARTKSESKEDSAEGDEAEDNQCESKDAKPEEYVFLFRGVHFNLDEFGEAEDDWRINAIRKEKCGGRLPLFSRHLLPVDKLIKWYEERDRDDSAEPLPIPTCDEETFFERWSSLNQDNRWQLLTDYWQSKRYSVFHEIVNLGYCRNTPCTRLLKAKDALLGKEGRGNPFISCSRGLKNALLAAAGHPDRNPAKARLRSVAQSDKAVGRVYVHH